jgi:hypothetical protein
MTWAESFGELLGRGVARGINSALSTLSLPSIAPGRDRSARAVSSGAVPADRQCKMAGCDRESRSKGLCSAHYQAQRRKTLAKA